MSTIVILLLCFISSALARADDEIDISFRVGGAAGSIKASSERGKESSNFGGIPFGIAWHKDLSGKFASMIQGMTLFDVVNTQLIRQGIEAGLSYHLLGGARRLVKQGGEAGIVSRSASALSLALRGGFQSFAATDKNDPTSRVSGSAFEVRSGLEYRQEMTDSGALVVELISTVFSVPASVDRLTPRAVELIFAWRTFL
jgi:hypothetical protein